jgi:hypothetical protein
MTCHLQYVEACFGTTPVYSDMCVPCAEAKRAAVHEDAEQERARVAVIRAKCRRLVDTLVKTGLPGGLRDGSKALLGYFEGVDK